jgi:hypothetical protein
MRVGRYACYLGWSMWPDRRWHYVDGRRYPPILTRIHRERVLFGQGGVIAFGGIMLWWTVDSRHPPRK